MNSNRDISRLLPVAQALFERQMRELSEISSRVEQLERRAALARERAVRGLQIIGEDSGPLLLAEKKHADWSGRELGRLHREIAGLRARREEQLPQARKAFGRLTVLRQIGQNTSGTKRSSGA